MTVHKWFKNKACPGDYLYSRHDDIVAKVNSLLKVDTEETPEKDDNADAFIWNFFKEKGLNDYAVAGIYGNLEKESGLRSNNLQNGYEQSLNHTDASYTRAVDDGSYTNFVNDKAGYGLAQWTFHTRKQALLDYAKSVGKSIGDLGMQLDFMWKEMQGYKKLMKILRNATSVDEASNAVLLQYEKPADQSELAQNRRARYGQTAFDKFANRHEETEVSPEPYYRVRKTWEDAESQLGAYKSILNAKNKVDDNPGYRVFDENGNIVYPEYAQREVAYAKSKSSSLAGAYMVTAKGGLNLRYVPGDIANDNIIQVLPEGCVITNYGYYTKVDGANWLYITYKNVTGFVHSKYVKKV